MSPFSPQYSIFALYKLTGNNRILCQEHCQAEEHCVTMGQDQHEQLINDVDLIFWQIHRKDDHPRYHILALQPLVHRIFSVNQLGNGSASRCEKYN